MAALSVTTFGSRVFAVAVIAGALVSFSVAVGQPVFTAFEEAERDPCDGAGDWGRSEDVRSYLEAGYYDFEKNLLAFTGASWRRLDPAMAERRHEQAKGLISQLGRLLPRLARPLDLEPLIAQVRAGRIEAPLSDHHTEFLGVALARELLAATDEAGTRIAAFLESLGEVEALLLEWQDNANEARDLARLAEKVEQLQAEYRAGLGPLAKQVIFAENLGERLAGRMVELCGERR
jgi:hypothetical protein